LKILVITDMIPFPTMSGAPLRIYNLLSRIAKEHHIWLVAFVQNPDQAMGVAQLQNFCQAVITVPFKPSHALSRPLDFFRYLFRGIPPDLRAYHSDELSKKIFKLASCQPFDLVQIEHSHMGLYLESLPLQGKKRTVWMLHDIDWSKFGRMVDLETKFTRKMRLWLHSLLIHLWLPGYAERFTSAITVSESDRQLLLAANPDLNLEVVPNGVDTEFLRPLPFTNSSPSLIFVGDMAYRPNIDAMIYFSQQILPHIKRAIPGVELWIVGKDPSHEVKQLHGNGIHITGRVEDVRPFYYQSSVCIVPLRAGGGTRLKILEAMAFTRPVVTTSIGCEGLDVIDGEHLFVADHPLEFADRTTRLLLDEVLRQNLVNHARQLVVDQYDWDVLACQLSRIYTDVAQRTPQ
jgi:sugar transferase (PEP-CTERM/EpsH1 system associated)